MIKKAKPGRREVIDEAPRLSSMAINAEASTLLVLMHNPEFVAPWRGQRLNLRLSLCSSLVDSLLGADDVLDNEYEITRALFKQLLTANT